jgi:hypothetical protein
MGSLMGMMQGYGGGGHAVAGAIGGMVLWAVAASLVAQVYLLGLCLVYLRVTEGLDPGAAEAALRDKLDDARRRAADLGEKARNATSRDAPTGAGAVAAAAAATVTPAYPPSPVAAPVVPAAVAAPPPYPPPAAPSYQVPAAFAAPPPFNPPPAYAPPHDFMAPAPPDTVDDPDIALPFDDLPHAAAPAPTPAYASPPVYVAPPVQPPVPVAPAPAATTTCPQCLSAVTAEDVFCGVCGYRLK